MAKIQILVCDVPKHQTEGHEFHQMQGELMPPMVINGVPKTIVLCEDHKAELSFADVIALYEALGEALTVETRPKKNRQKAPAKNTPPEVNAHPEDGDGKWHCHYCEDVRDTPQGRTRHEMSAHNEQWAKDREEKLAAVS